MMKILIAALIFIFAAGACLSQEGEPEIVTDRPDHTESAVTVPHKRLQIESGFKYAWDKKDAIKVRDLGYNATLLRYGILPRFELRMAASYANLETENSLANETTVRQGFAPLIVGIKWNFLLGDGPIPTLAFLSHVDIPPIASRDYNDLNVLHAWRFSGSWVLSKRFSFGVNFGYHIDWKRNDFTPLYTATLGMSITPWMGAYAELYGFLPAGEYSDHRYDMGLTFPVRPNLQFDISGGFGISKNSPAGFAGCGFSWRIPR